VSRHAPVPGCVRYHRLILVVLLLRRKPCCSNLNSKFRLSVVDYLETEHQASVVGARLSLLSAFMTCPSKANRNENAAVHRFALCSMHKHKITSKEAWEPAHQKELAALFS
jgi:hypothetical protein